MENDGYSEKSEHDAQEDWDNGANENGGRLTEESDMDQSGRAVSGAAGHILRRAEPGGEGRGETRQDITHRRLTYTDRLLGVQHVTKPVASQ